MSKMKKIGISLLMIFAMFSPTALAQGQSNQIDPSRDFGQVEPQAAPIVIFFGGMVVAEVTNGVITYTTGKPPSDWIALGLTNIESKIKSMSRNTIPYRSINVSRTGQVSGCVVYPCMVATSIEESSIPVSLEK